MEIKDQRTCDWYFEGEERCHCIGCFDFKKDYVPKGEPIPSSIQQPCDREKQLGSCNECKLGGI